MKYLIDTHLLIWWVNNDRRLPLKALQIIEDTEHDIAISIGSIWEIGIKHALGRLSVPDRFIETLPDMPFILLPVSASDTWEASHLTAIHKDPFDRLLVAQAKNSACTLLTVDKLLLGYGDHIELV